MNYLSIILTACLFFPLVAGLITIPYMIHQYHKYGSLPVIRVLIVYSFILYLLIVYFLVILPLPNINDVLKMTGPTTQLIPFFFIIDIINEAPRNLNFFISQPVYQVVYNVFLTIPFGVYLRYYFKKDLKHTIIYTFLLSLFFELTQLTGLYFLYPRAYRLFDIDDLIINTLGGTVGFYLTSLFTFFLPTREQLELISYKLGTKVSMMKRLTSYFLDLFFMLILFIPVSFILSLFSDNITNISETIILLIIYYVIIPTITKGYTIGKKIVNLKVVSLDNTTCKWYQYIIRYTLLYLVILGLPKLTIIIFLYLNDIFVTNQMLIFFTVYFFILFIMFIYILINNIFLKNLFLYERISKTHNVSTITIPK